MLRSVMQVGRPACETVPVLVVKFPKMRSKFSTMVLKERSSVVHSKVANQLSYKQSLRFLRGSYGQRPVVSRFQDESQEGETTIRNSRQPDSSRREEPILERVKSGTRDTNENTSKRVPIAPNLKTVKDMLNNSTSFSEFEPRDTPQREWTTTPYPKEAARRLQSSYAVRPQIDPKETCVILFPGQGIQYPGMGKNLLKYPNVKRIYNHASEIMGYDVLDMCLNGTKEELSKTEYCQPAIVATSLAAVEKLRDEAPHAIDSCVAVAGFSVGEITALMFAGALSFIDGMKLVRIRAEAMQGASEMEAGGMMTVFYGADARIGFACRAALEWCKKKGIPDAQCGVANYLYPGCKVIAGNDEALAFIAQNAKDFGIRRMKRLPVSGAFHTKMMLPAQQALAEAMDSITVNDPVISVHSNVDGKRYNNAKHIKRQLPKQICSAVKWEQTLHVLYERDAGLSFPRTYECGPGRSMKAILEKVNAKAHGSTISVDMDEMY